MTDLEKDLTQEEQVETVVPEEESVTVEENKNTTKINKNNKSKKGTSKIKGAFSELKKVSWPSFGKVMKQTAVVLSVTLVFLVVVIGIDQLLYLLYDLLTSNMS